MKGHCVLRVALALVLSAAACSSDDGAPPVDQNGTVGGHVMLALDGPLIGAQVSIDLLEYTAATPIVRRHIDDRTTDANGYFESAVGQASGYFLVTVRGGQFTDYATGARVVLDPADELKTILYTDPLEDLTTGLVSPVSHLAHALIVARTSAGLDASLIDAHDLANEHLDRHFGDLRWERAQPVSLAAAQPSPTDGVRAAFILGAWSLAAADIAAASGASVQQVNPFTLAVDLAADLGNGPFTGAHGPLDGDDANDPLAGTGIQLATCPPVEPTCIATGVCTLGQCRTLCDAYAGTLRATLVSQITRLINDNGVDGRNQTGLSVADALGFARTMANNGDAVLFGTACIEPLDSVAPTLVWGAVPADGTVVRGPVTITASATDDTGGLPTVTWEGGLADTDGTVNAVATTIDTSMRLDSELIVRARAVDATGNATNGMLRIVTDNTAPVLTVADDGFYVDGRGWWSSASGPTLTGTVDDPHGPITITATISGNQVASTTVASGAWSLTLPPGSIDVAGGSEVFMRAADAVGNTTLDSAATSPRVNVDATPPIVESIARTFLDEGADTITFNPASMTTPPPPQHRHDGAAVAIGGATPLACALVVVRKYAYRTDTAPVGSENVANPVAFSFRASDGGVGLAEGLSTFTVVAPSGQMFGPFDLLSTSVPGSPGAFDAVATLVRNGVATTTAAPVGPIGVPGITQEGVYQITFTARDHLGQTNTITRCMNYEPLGPPMQVTQNAQPFVRSTMFNSIVTALIDTYALPTGTTSALLNGTAKGGMMELRLKNTTGDPAFVTFVPIDAANPRYTKRIVTYLQPTTLTVVFAPRCNLDPDDLSPLPSQNALCYGQVGAIRPDLIAASTPIPTWFPSVALYEVHGADLTAESLPCAGCDPREWEILPDATHAVVVGVASVPELRPDAPGPYSEADGDYTGALDPGAPTVNECAIWVPGGTPAAPYQTCTRLQAYAQWRVLWQAGLATDRVQVDWSSAVSGTLAARSDWMTGDDPLPRRIASFSWSPTEQ